MVSEYVKNFGRKVYVSSLLSLLQFQEEATPENVNEVVCKLTDANLVRYSFLLTF